MFYIVCRLTESKFKSLEYFVAGIVQDVNSFQCGMMMYLLNVTTIATSMIPLKWNLI
jgi:hypothetical protein